jgi:hypothetical protein
MAGHDLDHQFPGPGPQPVPAPAPHRRIAAPDAGRAGWMLRGTCRSENPELFFPIAAAGPALSSRWSRWPSPATGDVITGAWLEFTELAARAPQRRRDHAGQPHGVGAPRATGAADIPGSRCPGLFRGHPTWRATP